MIGQKKRKKYSTIKNSNGIPYEIDHINEHSRFDTYGTKNKTCNYTGAILIPITLLRIFKTLLNYDISKDYP